MDQIIAELKKIPPVTRFCVVSLAGLTIPVMMKVLDPRTLIYYHPWVWHKLQVRTVYTMWMNFL